MAWVTLMVHVDTDEASDARLRLALRLREQLDATLIGVAAYAVRPPLIYDGLMVDPQSAQIMIDTINDDLRRLAAQFHAKAGSGPRVEWRESLDFPTEAVTRKCRAADLLVIGRDRSPGDVYRSLDPGSTILKAGRPVLAVPPGTDSLQADRVLVAWKDTRESRRAVHDALPVLRGAKWVGLATISEAEDEARTLASLDDVAAFLARHRIEVTAKIASRHGGSVAQELLRLIEQEHVDLIVSGAYGHTRLGEWMFGGVTRDLLSGSPVCCLFSH